MVWAGVGSMPTARLSALEMMRLPHHVSLPPNGGVPGPIRTRSLVKIVGTVPLRYKIHCSTRNNYCEITVHETDYEYLFVCLCLGFHCFVIIILTKIACGYVSMEVGIHKFYVFL